MMNHLDLVEMLHHMSLVMEENRTNLIDLDSIVGDGDLGLTMGDGFLAAYEAVKDGAESDCGKLLYQAGKAMANKVPSTMGTLMASGFMRAGKTLKGKNELNHQDVVTMFEAYQEGVVQLGKAKAGDKTFLDGFEPAVRALKSAVEEGKSLEAAAGEARKAAEQGFEHTTTMIAVHGRAATRGEASRSLKDPGAAVAALMMKGFAEMF